MILSREQIIEILAKVRGAIESLYTEHQDEPDYDHPLYAAIISEMENQWHVVMLPMDQIVNKDHLIAGLHSIGENYLSAPTPVLGILLAVAGYTLDPDSRERIGECVIVSLETPEGLEGQMLFDVVRTATQTQLVFKHSEVHETGTEPGNFQGFFKKPVTH